MSNVKKPLKLKYFVMRNSNNLMGIAWMEKFKALWYSNKLNLKKWKSYQWGKHFKKGAKSKIPWSLRRCNKTFAKFEVQEKVTPRIIFIYLLRTFCPHRGIFVVVSFHYVSAKFHLWPSSGDQPRPWIGMLSLVTVSPVITAFHSCCLSHHVFDKVNLWPAWVGIETAIFWQCPPGTVETQRLYPLRHGHSNCLPTGKSGDEKIPNATLCGNFQLPLTKSGEKRGTTNS